MDRTSRSSFRRSADIAEIRALHCSYGVGDEESYKRALTFLENCERYTLRSLVRRLVAEPGVPTTTTLAFLGAIVAKGGCW